jgi:hypothetical protein
LQFAYLLQAVVVLIVLSSGGCGGVVGWDKESAGARALPGPSSQWCSVGGTGGSSRPPSSGRRAVGGTGGAAPVEGAGGQWAKSPSQAVVMVGADMMQGFGPVRGKQRVC